MSMSTQPGGSSLNPLHFRMLLQQLEDLAKALQMQIEHLRDGHGAGRHGHLEAVSGATKKHVNHSLPKGKYREKASDFGRPKSRPRRIIHQPR